MLVTLVAILCNLQLCEEKVVTTSEQSGINMISCQMQGQTGVSQWMASSPYRDWRLNGWKCIQGQYVPKRSA
jgi:hypothetical protein